MDPALLAYPFLFAAIYFEVFLLITFLSAPARATRALARSGKTPKVAIVVPCYNEATTIAATADSLLALDYPKSKLHIVLVDDGSTDTTPLAMSAFAHNPQVTIIRQKNSGKHVALNAGIAAVPDAALIGCLDADSFVEKSALREMISSFDNPKVGAATAAMSVHKPKNMLQEMQNAEYIIGIALRHILSSINGLYVTPGPFSLYRRDVVAKLGGFRNGHNAEDMEMALRIQRAGFTIESAIKSRVFTSAPKSVPALVKQRTRWTTGFLRNVLYEYRDLVGNPRYGALGLIVLPLGFMAIGGGILMFFVVLYQLIENAVKTYLLVSSVPLSYTLSNLVPRFAMPELFYFPLTMFLMLSFIAMVGSVLFVLVGKKISETPARLGPGLVGYMFIYGLIAPFWLLRAVADVATGTQRRWK